MKLVLITGAGASTAFGINGRRLPMMEGWNDDLRKRLGAQADQLGLTAGMNGSAFEERIGAFLAAARGLDDVAGFSWLGVKPQRPPDPANYDAWFEQAKLTSRGIQTKLFESLHELFGLDQIDIYGARDAWSQLLKALPEPLITAAATTNYDVSMEVALRELQLRPDCGEDSTYDRNAPNRVHVDGLLNQGGRVPMLYLHGRIGWYVDADDNLVSRPPNMRFDPDCGRPAFLLPDPKKTYLGTAVEKLWAQFVEALADCDNALVIGHSLNDDALVEALRHVPAERLAIGLYARPDQDHFDSLIPEKDRIERALGRETAFIPIRFDTDVRASRHAWERFRDRSKPQWDASYSPLISIAEIAG